MRLAKRDDHRFGIGTSPALEGQLVVVNLLVQFDLCEKHGLAALRAQSLGERWRRRLEVMRPWHRAVLCYTTHPRRKFSLCPS